jgi:hypothetical protein
MKQVKKFLRVRNLAFLLVAAVFALAGFLGGAFAPILKHLNAASLVNNASGNGIVGTSQIENLPKKRVRIDETIVEFNSSNAIVGTDNRPKRGSSFNGSEVKLFRGEEQEIRVTQATPGTAEKITYPYSGDYEWRFFIGDVEVYNFPFTVYQDTYTMSLPQNGAIHEGDGAISMVPNIIDASGTTPVLFPLPDKFVDKSGNDLFDQYTEDVLVFQGNFLNDLTDGWSATEQGATHKTDAQNGTKSVKERTEAFKKYVWSNMKISYPGAKNTHTFDGEKSGLIYGQTNSKNARTFKTTTPGTFYAKYEFYGNKNIKSTFTTTSITVETFKKSDIIYKTPMWPSSVVNSFSVGKETEIPLPTVNLATATDINKTATDLGFQPVTFKNNETKVSNYTFAEIERYAIGDPYDAEHRTIAGRADETNGYKFTPTSAGTYAICYYVTTIFGTGNGAAYNDLAQENKPIIVERNGISYVKFYGQNTPLVVVRSEVAPELKWTVPFEYYVSGGDVLARSAINSKLFTDKYGNPMVTNSTVLEKHTANSTPEQLKDNKKFFTDAPDLKQYMPVNDSTAVTQILADGKLVLPALIGSSPIASGRDLEYIITLKGTTGDTVTFKNTSSATGVTGLTEYKYDHNKALILDFGATSGQYLSTWNGKSSSTFTLTVSANDLSAAETVFKNRDYGTYSSSKVYTFTTVDNSKYNSSKKDPTWNTASIIPSQPSYYRDDVISFPVVSAYEATTPNMQIEYYLTWDKGSATDGGSIKLDHRNIKNNTVSFDLSNKNADANKIFASMGTGNEFTVKAVVVAKTFRALTNQIETGSTNAFTANGDWADLTAIDGTTHNAKNMNEFIDAQAVTTGDVTIDGIAVKTVDIKIYSHGGALVPNIALVKGTTTDSGSGTTTDAGLWNKLYNDGASNDGTTTIGTKSKVKKNVEYDLPGFDVTYTGASSAINTTVRVSLISPTQSDASTGLTGEGVKSLSIKGDTADKNIYTFGEMKFKPQQIGYHTFVFVVANSGNKVAVFTAQINVVGTPDIVADLNITGDTRAKIGQTVTLPGASIFIQGKEFKTWDNMSIILKGDEGTIKDDAQKTKVGKYSLGGNFNGSKIILSNNQIIPLVEGTYKFNYTFEFTKFVSGDTIPSGHAVGDYKLDAVLNATFADLSVQTKAHNVIVGALENGDLSVKMDDATYENLANGTTAFAQNKGDAKDRLSGTVGADNLFTEMVSAQNIGELTLTNTQLDGGMTVAKFGEYGQSDIYDFAPIFLPKVFAQWENGLSNVLNYSSSLNPNGLKTADALRVTVEHSSAPGEPIFDSKNIGAESNEEIRVATINGMDYYYFQPRGEVKYLGKPTTSAGSVAAPASAPFDVARKGGAIINTSDFENGDRYPSANRVPATGLVYYYLTAAENPGKADGWYKLDYNDTTFREGIHYTSSSSLVKYNEKPDGIYTIKYEIAYGGITAEKSFTIAVGDTKVPTFEFDTATENDLFYKTYKKGEWFKFNSNQVTVKSNGGYMTARVGENYAPWYVARNLSFSVTGPDNSPLRDEIIKTPVNVSDLPLWQHAGKDNYTVKSDESVDEAGYVYKTATGAYVFEKTGDYQNREWRFQFEQAGDYHITLYIQSETGRDSEPKSFTIHIDEDPEKTKISPQTIWGTILIIISSGLLLGVIVYFIQTGRRTKFAGTAKPVKEKAAKEKDKE